MNHNVINIIPLSMQISKEYGAISFDKRIELICSKINLNNGDLILNATGEGLLAINLLHGILKILNPNKSSTSIILSVDAMDQFPDYNCTVSHTGTVCNWGNYFYELQSKNIDWSNIEIDYHILALARRPTVSRAYYIKDVIDIYDENCLVSFGFGDIISREIKEILKPHSLPIVIDGHKTHEVPNDKIFKSLFNLVLETNEPDFQEIRLTEKSYKPYAWHQIPIFVSSNGHVDILRKLGFDMFDDLLNNHSYTSNLPHLYQIKVRLLLENLLKQYPTVDSIRKLRKDLWPRIVYNHNLLNNMIIETELKGIGYRND